MKKFAVLALAFLAGPAFATEVCTGDKAAEVAVVAKDFIANDFKQKCSANVFLDFEVSATAAAVGAASKKGKSIFSGTSEGGSVAPTTTGCDATGCTKADSAGAATAALSALSGTTTK